MEQLVNDGIRTKISMIGEESQEKLQAGDRVWVSYSRKEAGEKQIIARKITRTESEE